MCNMGCSYCYYLGKEELYGGGSVQRMPDLLLEEYIVQHIEASGEELIHFAWHGGEPLLAGLEFFKKAVDIQKRYCPQGGRILNGIQTNGTLLDPAWCEFLARENFLVGISIDGPEPFHSAHRRDHRGNPTYQATVRGYHLLRQFGVQPEILCVVNSRNVPHPAEVYDFFLGMGASYLTFLPLVEYTPEASSGEAGSYPVSSRSVAPEEFGEFLIRIFERWKERDIGKIKVQIFEEALRSAFGQDHTLCIFKKTCGRVPVLEHNGDFYSCDHYVDREHRPGNILETHLGELLEGVQQTRFGEAKYTTLPKYCLQCEVLEMCGGECPRNRFISTPGGEPGLNYLCKGYKMFFTHCAPFVSEVARIWETDRDRKSPP